MSKFYYCKDNDEEETPTWEENSGVIPEVISDAGKDQGNIDDDFD